MSNYFTKEGLEKLKKELEYLKTVKRFKIAQTLKHAASFGDLRENFGYQQAKDEQGRMEDRIRELGAKIAQAKIIDPKVKLGAGVQIGVTVTLESGKEKQTFQIVGKEEANPLRGKISFESPLGQALLGKKAGDKVTVETPNGKTDYKILQIH